MPPSIPDDLDLDLKSPAPPVDAGPQPPAPPDPVLLELFEKNPDGFPAAFSLWQQQQQHQQQKSREKRRTSPNALKRPRYPSYDQFITAAVVIGLDLRQQQEQQRSTFTMFAPSDLYLSSRNISLPLLVLKDAECIKRIVRYVWPLVMAPFFFCLFQDNLMKT